MQWCSGINTEANARFSCEQHVFPCQHNSRAILLRMQMCSCNSSYNILQFLQAVHFLLFFDVSLPVGKVLPVRFSVFLPLGKVLIPDGKVVLPFGSVFPVRFNVFPLLGNVFTRSKPNIWREKNALHYCRHCTFFQKNSDGLIPIDCQLYKKPSDISLKWP